MSRLLAFVLFLALFLADGITPALAAGADKASEATFVLQIVLLVVLGRAFGEGMQRIGQPAVMGQIAAGIVLGPSVLGGLWPSFQAKLFPPDPMQMSMINGVATVGILMLLLLSGMETDLRLVRKIGRPALIISAAGIAVPFLLGFGATELLPVGFLPNANQRLLTALFLGTTLAISSVKIVAMVVRELDFERRNIGQILLASSILDDTLAWILLGIISSLAANGSVDLPSVARSVVGTVLFLAISFAVGRQVVFRLIRFTNDNFLSELSVPSVIVALMGGMALITDAIGVHTVLGAFVAGMLIGDSPILTRQIDAQLRGLITALFMPVFFGLSGLTADLRVLADPAILLLTLGIVLIASIGKFAGAFLGGRLAGLSAKECLTLGCGMNARGSTEVIIATIGLSIGLIDRTLYTMIVTMALVTTLAMPPMLRWALSRLPFSEEEKDRLKREAFADRSFVGSLERLLVAVDESPNGQFASRLAGLLAGNLGFPATVLHLTGQGSGGGGFAVSVEDGKNAGPDESLRAAAESTKSGEAPAESEPSPPVEVTLRRQAAPLQDAVAAEAGKGYDMLVIGIDRPVSSDGRFVQDLTDIAAAFEGPLAIVNARGIHLRNPLERRLRILVPVNGTETARNALEVAAALAAATEGRVTALHVSNAQRSKRGFSLSRLRSMENQELILKDAAALAEEHGAEARTMVSSNAAPEDSILRYANRARYDLVVMGVNKRPGDRLYFGEVAASLLEKAERSLLLVSS
jgi:Kef-type K+ transport system membrane component KefB/nucleotide-binding universal stress UspA family protein